MGPAYRQIAEEIRGRIHSGELRAGARVPSARQITKQWGVAIATATKVLAALQQDGLVHAVPGVGTVVSGRSRVEPAAPVPAKAVAEQGVSEQGLSRERIVRAAVELADAEGLAALSMRRLATELGFATMSLYRHVRSRDELLTHMIDTAFAEFPLPVDRPTGWRAQLELAAHRLWDLFRRHRWLAASMSLTRPQLAPHALRYTDWVLQALFSLNLTASEITHVHVMLFSYVRGLAISFESEVDAEQDTGMSSDEWMAAQERSLSTLAGSTAFGNFMRLVQESQFEFDLDSLFAFGLARMLDGLTVHTRQ